MKQKFTFTISLLISSFYPTHAAMLEDWPSSMSQQSECLLSLQSFDGNKFEKIAREMWAPVKQSEGREIVIFMGPTKVGKSTTANYLCGLPMKEYEDEYGDELIQVDLEQLEKEKEKYKGVKIAPIGNDNYRSCTQWPLCYKENRFQLTFCDLPGLSHSEESIERDAAIALSAKSTISHSKGVKAIILLVSRGNFDAAGGTQVESLFEALLLTLDNPQQHAASIFFALTREKEANKKLLMGEVARFRNLLEKRAQKKFPFLAGNFEELRKANDQQTLGKILSSFNKKSLNTILKMIKDGGNTTQDGDGFFSNYKRYQVLRKEFNVDLYVFLNCMLNQHQENFLGINPLDQTAIAPILERVSQSNPIPKQEFKFIGTAEVYEACMCLYKSVVKNANTLLAELHKEKTKSIDKIDLQEEKQKVRKERESQEKLKKEKKELDEKREELNTKITELESLVNKLDTDDSVHLDTLSYDVRDMTRTSQPKCCWGKWSFSLNAWHNFDIPYHHFYIIQKRGRIQRLEDRSNKKQGILDISYKITDHSDPILTLKVYTYNKHKERKGIKKYKEDIRRAKGEREEIEKKIEIYNESIRKIKEESQNTYTQIQTLKEKEEEAHPTIGGIKAQIEANRNMFEFVHKTYAYITPKVSLVKEFEEKFTNYLQSEREHNLHSQSQTLSVGTNYIYKEGE